MYTLGIDLHKQFALWSMVDDQGSVMWQKKLDTDLASLPAIAETLPTPCQAVLEPTGCFALYAQILEEHQIKTHLAHPVKVKYIAESKNKNDKIDATILAQLLRTNFLPEAYLPTCEIRELRSLLNYRNQLVTMRTMAKNRMRMLLNQLNIKAKFSDIFGKKGIVFLRSLNLSALNQVQRDQLINVVGNLNSHIKAIKQGLDKIAIEDDDIVRMQTIPSVGVIAATTIKAYVGDFSRFPNAKKLASYAGLVPSVRQSGTHTKTGHITKEGPKILRAVLVQAATSMRPSAGELYKQHQKRSKEIGFKKARIALAKKLLTIAYRVVTDKTIFQDSSNCENTKLCLQHNPDINKEMSKTRSIHSASN